MIEIICDACDKPLTELGALMFSPPNELNQVQKYHICKECFKDWIVDYD